MKFKEIMIKFGNVMTKFGKAAWRYIKVAKIELIVIAAAIAFDLITKAIIAGTMSKGESIAIIPNFLHFTYVINTKAAFGSAFGLEKFLSDASIRIIFLVVTGIAMAVFAYFMYRFRSKPLVLRISFALIIGGGLGNYYDRLFLSGVRDFMEIIYFGLDIPWLGSSFAIFNMADAILTAGVVVFLVYYLFLYKDPKKLPAKVATEGEDAEISQDVANENAGLDNVQNTDNAQNSNNQNADADNNEVSNPDTNSSNTDINSSNINNQQENSTKQSATENGGFKQESFDD